MKHFILIILALASSIITSAQLEIPARLTDRPELIIKHCGYTLSYNASHGTPNWVAWMLTKSNANGKESRTNLFLPDPCVPYKYRICPSDYTNSGYDRGHLYPAADASWSKESMHDCFYMTNMAPQTPALNRVSWKALESACRKWAMTEDTLYIVCGPIYKPPYKRIGRTHYIDVPTGFYKVVLSLRKGHAKAIGFFFLNNSKKQPLGTFWNVLKPFETYGATTVDVIEKLTGIDFFSSLPDSTENIVESRFNLKDWK